MHSDKNPGLTRQNTHEFLSQFMDKNSVTARQIAKVIGCSEETTLRIVNDVTWPSDEMMRRCHTMVEIGYKDYSKLSEAEKEKISEAIGAISGSGLGIGISLAAVSALGTAGISAVGMTSGLAALGAIIGGGMFAGIGVVAAIPLVVGAVGYGVVKLVKGTASKINLDAATFDSHWEVQKMPRS